MSGDGNPLVAPRVDSTGGVDGLWLVEAIRDVTDSIQSRSWVDPTLAAGGVGLETLGLVVDPVGSLAGMGAAWLIEHVRPLSEALEFLAGDPDQITAHAHTWTNIATHTHACADQLATTSEQLLAGWTGQAAEAFQAHTATQAAALAGIARGATGIAEATRGAAELVAAVRILVRDLVAEAIATIAARLPGWAAATGVTLGIATPFIVAQVANLVAEWVTRIHRLLTGLLNSLANLSPLLARLTDLLAQQRTLLTNLARHDPTTLRLADTGSGPSQRSFADRDQDASDQEGAAESATHVDAARVVDFPIRRLQHAFDHASDFVIQGNWSKARGEEFQRALGAHIHDPETREIKGTYRGVPVTHYYNPETGLNVFVDSENNLWSGWRLSPRQVEHLLRDGKLGGDGG